MVDGQLNRPTAAGKGGFNRGFPALPSNDLIGGVSLRSHFAVDVDIEVVATAASVLTDQTFLICLLDSTLQHCRSVIELAPNVDISGGSVYYSTDDKTALNEFMWILLHDFSAFVYSRLAFICVNDEIARFGVLLPALEVHERLPMVSANVATR